MAKKPDLLNCVVDMESAAFRVGQLARALKVDHPDLWQLVESMQPRVYADGGFLTLEVARLDVVQEWGERLGIPLRNAYTASAYAEPACGHEHLDGEGTVAGVRVRIGACRRVGPEEWAARQAAAGDAR